VTYACPTWEFAAETYLFKLQRLQNRGFHSIENFSRCTSIHDMHVASQIPYIYDYITKLCRREAEIIQSHENENVHNIGQGETPHTKYKRLKLGGCHMYNC
jgi:hypothetical protein